MAFVRDGEQHRHIAHGFFCDWIFDSHRRLFPRAGTECREWVRDETRRAEFFRKGGRLRGDVVARIGVPAPTTSPEFRHARCLVIGTRVRPYLSILAEVRNRKPLGIFLFTWSAVRHLHSRPKSSARRILF